MFVLQVGEVAQHADSVDLSGMGSVKKPQSFTKGYGQSKQAKR